MEDDEQEEMERVRVWIGRLEAFTAALGTIDGETATGFCDSACEAWKHFMIEDMPSKARPAMLIAFEAQNALVQVAKTVVMGWADAPDVRDRFTRESAQQLAKDALDEILREAQSWTEETMPLAEQIHERLVAVNQDVKRAMDIIGKRSAELDEQDAEAAVDQYGAILSHRDPSRSDAHVLEKICSFTEEENSRYRAAYDRLRRMLDSELLQHISDESDRLCDVVLGVLHELQGRQLSVTDEDAMDERRRKIRSALISFTSALQIHEYQTIRSARRTQGLGVSQVGEVKALFADLKATSFEYRWLEALRDALQHGDINSFKWSFNVSVRADPEVKIDMDRAFMLEFTKENRNRPWLKRRELEERSSDPSVLDMIKAIRPLMGPLQEKLDKILYPCVADDATTIRELIGQFQGRPGMYAMQSGPGFTRRNLVPPLFRLAPRVLHFAQFVHKDDDGVTVQPDIV